MGAAKHTLDVWLQFLKKDGGGSGTLSQPHSAVSAAPRKESCSFSPLEWPLV